VTCPCNDPRLPPFDGPLPLVTIRPDGVDGTGQLPESLAVLPALPQQLPPTSQELVMNMFRDRQGMMPLKAAGLMAMVKSGKTDPAVVARVANPVGRTSPRSLPAASARSWCGSRTPQAE
jgi:blue copper oxidase